MTAECVSTSVSENEKKNISVGITKSMRTIVPQKTLLIFYQKPL